MSTTRQRGSQWEQVAESFLNKHGLRTLQRNYQARFGEIDLVMLDGNTLVFTEVRYRESDSHGSGAESITWRKQQRIIKAAELYLKHQGSHATQPCRFDVVSIGNDQGRTLLNWIRNAFDAG